MNVQSINILMYHSLTTSLLQELAIVKLYHRNETWHSGSKTFIYFFYFFAIDLSFIIN